MCDTRRRTSELRRNSSVATAGTSFNIQSLTDVLRVFGSIKYLTDNVICREGEGDQNWSVISAVIIGSNVLFAISNW